MDAALIRKIFDVNTFSFYSMSIHGYKYLEKSNGKLVIVSSTAGLIGLPNTVAYAGSKHALVGYFDGFRADLMKFNKNQISITIASLGAIDTDTARTNTKGSISDMVTWYPADDCARAILFGAESKQRHVYYPYPEVRGVQIAKTFAHPLVDYIIRNYM